MGFVLNRNTSGTPALRRNIPVQAPGVNSHHPLLPRAVQSGRLSQSKHFTEQLTKSWLYVQHCVRILFSTIQRFTHTHIHTDVHTPAWNHTCATVRFTASYYLTSSLSFNRRVPFRWHGSLIFMRWQLHLKNQIAISQDADLTLLLFSVNLHLTDGL